MPARSTGFPKDSTGFESTAMRHSAPPKRAAIRRSPLGNRRLAADKLRDKLDATEQSRATHPGRQGRPKGERGAVHQFGVPPESNATSACTQHFIHHRAPHGMVGFVLANGSMSSNQSSDCPARSAMKKLKAKPQSLPRQRDIHRALIKADLVDCMAALPGQFLKNIGSN